MFSQQITQYSNFVANSFFYNPAVVGGHDCLVVKSGHRNQWTGFEGSPKSTFLSLSTSVHNSKKFHPGTFVGLGGYFQTETFGAFKKSTLNFAYAYTTPINEKTTVAFGAYLGLQQLGIDASLINMHDGFDPLILGSSEVFLIPDLGAGAFIEREKSYLGYSIKQITANNWSKLVESSLSKNQWHHLIMGGKRFDKNKINVVPNFLFKYVKGSLPSVDLNLNLEFSDVFNVGCSWRNTDAIVLTTHFKVLDHLHFYYAYDITTSNINSASNNTHELIIGYKHCPKSFKKDPVSPIFY